jgi:hypothetical protein
MHRLACSAPPAALRASPPKWHRVVRAMLRKFDAESVADRVVVEGNGLTPPVIGL